MHLLVLFKDLHLRDSHMYEKFTVNNLDTGLAILCCDKNNSY